MLKKTKVIAIGNLKGGVGKSTITRVMALLTDSIMLNMDDKRDASQYSSTEIKQKNVPKNIAVLNSADGLIVGDKTLNLNTDFAFLDFGGVFDERLPACNADYYVVPTLGDKESIIEGIRTALFIKKFNPKANILFIFNEFGERSKERIKEQKADLRKKLNENGLTSSSLIDLPYNALFPKLTTKQLKLSELLKNPLESYRLKTVLFPKVKEIIEIINN